MALTPEKIFKNFRKNEIDKRSAAKLLISIAENADDIDIRLESIKFLQKIEFSSQNLYSLLENLLVSEDNSKIRILAAKTLISLFQNKALNPLKWALYNEKELGCLTEITSNIAEITSSEAKSVLIERINKIQNFHFISSFKELFKYKEIQDFDNQILAEIINNYNAIEQLESKLKKFSYHVENGLVTELDLSYLSTIAGGWKILKDLTQYIKILRDLKKLDLRVSKIGALPPSIDSLTYLTYLDLNQNFLKYLPDSITSLKSLKFLYLEHNLLKNLPESFGSLKLLKCLDLRHNKLSSLPKSFIGLDSLESLNLNGNQLTAIPDCLKPLKLLEKLDIGLNNIKIIPEWVRNFKSLTKLGLRGNTNLIHLEKWIDYLPPIKELNLGNVNLKKVPASIETLQSLEKITLNNNSLKNLPESFVKLESLKKINIGWNDFTNIPDWIGSFPNLEELNLEGNNLNIIPGSISLLPSLKVLNLKLNRRPFEIPKSVIELKQKGLIIYI